jgi:hypothetical protein
MYPVEIGVLQKSSLAFQGGMGTGLVYQRAFRSGV